MEWQPIETAPKDGTRVLIWSMIHTAGKAVGARWNDDRYAKKPRPYWQTDTIRIDGVDQCRAYPPEFWVPLPPPPQS